MTANGRCLWQRTEAPVFGVVLFAIGFCWMYRRWLFNGFDAVFGDEGDGQTLIVILEHWHQVFRGVAGGPWRSPPVLYPEPGVGYTDTFFLYAIEYSVLRALSFDPYLAFMSVMATLSLLGFVGFMRLAIVEFDITGAHVAVGALLFVFANMMIMKVGHAQSYCAMLLPFVIMLAASGYRAQGCGALR